jgi:superfamily II DNA or RNA helicase
MTATPERADGKGLGLEADGFAQTMVLGPTPKWLIENAYLSPYQYFAPETDIDLTGLRLTDSGDVSAKEFRARVVDSRMVGDVVEHYKKYAPGKQAIVFASDVATCMDLEKAFMLQGISATALSGDTDSGIRDTQVDAFENREIQVLINCDLFDEGFDVPGVEAVILARFTESLAKYLQMVGRGLRPVYAPGYDLDLLQGRKAAIAAGDKPHAIVIDAVRNWERHISPDWPRTWTLASRPKGTRAARPDLLPQRICLECAQLTPRSLRVCAFCGAPPEQVADRSTPEKVDGDLQLLDLEALHAIYARIEAANMSAEAYRQRLFEPDANGRIIPPKYHGAAVRRHEAAKTRRRVLYELIGWWMGGHPPERPIYERQRLFYLRFGIDCATCQTLPEKETDQLIDLITQRFSEDLQR